MLLVAASLGAWQVRRLAWKTELLASIDRGEAAPARPLPPDPAPFSRVVAQGRFRQGATALYGAEVRIIRTGPAMGAQALAALERPGADPLVVDLGWVPEGAIPPLPEGEVQVVGYVRPPEHTPMFGAGDDPAARRFFALDPAAIGRAFGLPQVAPFTLVALGTAVPGVYPQPAPALPRPPNNHLAYAVTWFGLATSLLGVFLLHARKVLRR